VDEPTGLPEGTEVDLVPADDVDELPPEERAKLYGFLAASIGTHVPGKGTPAEVLLSGLRQRGGSSSRTLHGSRYESPQRGGERTGRFAGGEALPRLAT